MFFPISSGLEGTRCFVFWKDKKAAVLDFPPQSQSLMSPRLALTATLTKWPLPAFPHTCYSCGHRWASPSPAFPEKDGYLLLKGVTESCSLESPCPLSSLLMHVSLILCLSLNAMSPTKRLPGRHAQRPTQSGQVLTRLPS